MLKLPVSSMHYLMQMGIGHSFILKPHTYLMSRVHQHSDADHVPYSVVKMFLALERELNCLPSSFSSVITVQHKVWIEGESFFFI